MTEEMREVLKEEKFYPTCLCCKTKEIDNNTINKLRMEYNKEDISNIPYICDRCSKTLSTEEYGQLMGNNTKKEKKLAKGKEKIKNLVEERLEEEYFKEI